MMHSYIQSNDHNFYDFWTFYYSLDKNTVPKILFLSNFKEYLRIIGVYFNICYDCDYFISIFQKTYPPGEEIQITWVKDFFTKYFGETFRASFLQIFYFNMLEKRILKESNFLPIFMGMSGEILSRHSQRSGVHIVHREANVGVHHKTESSNKTESNPPLFFTPAGLGTKQYNQSYLIKGRSIPLPKYIPGESEGMIYFEWICGTHNQRQMLNNGIEGRLTVSATGLKEFPNLDINDKTLDEPQFVLLNHQGDIHVVCTSRKFFTLLKLPSKYKLLLSKGDYILLNEPVSFHVTKMKYGKELNLDRRKRYLAGQFDPLIYAPREFSLDNPAEEEKDIKKSEVGEIEIEFVVGEHIGEKYKIKEGEGKVNIGRSTTANIKLTAGAISSEHCYIEYNPHVGWIICDPAGSTNGTFIALNSFHRKMDKNPSSSFALPKSAELKAGQSLFKLHHLSGNEIMSSLP